MGLLFLEYYSDMRKAIIKKDIDDVHSFAAPQNESGWARGGDAAGVRSGRGNVRPLLRSRHHEADLSASQGDLQHVDPQAE